MQNISFTDHILLVKQQNMVIGLRKMKKHFKDKILTNQTKDIMMTKTMLHITTSLTRYTSSLLSAWSIKTCLISISYSDPDLLLLS